MPDVNAFLAAAEVESTTPSISVGLASGMIPPPLRELMRLAAEEKRVSERAVTASLPPAHTALAERLATAFRTLPPARAEEFEHSVADFIDRWLNEHRADA